MFRICLDNAEPLCLDVCNFMEYHPCKRFEVLSNVRNVCGLVVFRTVCFIFMMQSDYVSVELGL